MPLPNSRARVKNWPELHQCSNINKLNEKSSTFPSCYHILAIRLVKRLPSESMINTWLSGHQYLKNFEMSSRILSWFAIRRLLFCVLLYIMSLWTLNEICFRLNIHVTRWSLRSRLKNAAKILRKQFFTTWSTAQRNRKVAHGPGGKQYFKVKSMCISRSSKANAKT